MPFTEHYYISPRSPIHRNAADCDPRHNPVRSKVVPRKIDGVDRHDVVEEQRFYSTATNCVVITVAGFNIVAARRSFHCDVIILQTSEPDRGQVPLQRDIVAGVLVQRGRRCDDEVCCKMFCAKIMVSWIIYYLF